MGDRYIIVRTRVVVNTVCDPPTGTHDFIYFTGFNKENGSSKWSVNLDEAYIFASWKDAIVKSRSLMSGGGMIELHPKDRYG